jgi:non-specific serine/threonine protein kinase
MRGPDVAEWTGRLEAELGNLRGALEWFEAEQTAIAFQKLAAQISGLLAERGHLREGTLWLEKALALVDDDPGTRVLALSALCALLMYQGCGSELRPIALEIDRLQTELGDEVGRVRALTLLAWAATAEGDSGEARRLHEEAVVRARATGDRWSLLLALNNLGSFLIEGHKFDDAALALAEALGISRAEELHESTARVLANLGLALGGRGDVEGAAGHLREALVMFADTAMFAADEAFLGLAAVASASGDPRRATRLLGASNRLVDEFGLSRGGYPAQLDAEIMAVARTALGGEVADQLLVEGEKMRRDEAIAYALEGEASPP